MFTTSGTGTPVAHIVGGKKDGKILRLNDEEPEGVDDDILDMLRAVLGSSRDFVTDGEIYILPSRETERVYIAGKSGCGKSTLAARYMNDYLQLFPDRRVILFSRHQEEKAYKGIPHHAVELNEELTESPLELTEIKDSLVVFDDTDNLQDRKLKKALQALNDDIISNGRKYNIHCLTLAHQLLNYKESRNLLNEANKVIFFNNGTTYHIKNYLARYAGIDKEKIDKILTIKSRWTMISLGNPMYILHDHGAFLLSG